MTLEWVDGTAEKEKKELQFSLESEFVLFTFTLCALVFCLCDDVRFPETKVTDSRQLPCGIGPQTWVLCQGSQPCELLSPSFSPKPCDF